LLVAVKASKSKINLGVEGNEYSSYFWVVDRDHKSIVVWTLDS